MRRTTSSPAGRATDERALEYLSSLDAPREAGDANVGDSVRPPLSLSPRLERHVRRRFDAPLHDQVLEALRTMDLDEVIAQHADLVERIQTAAIRTSRGYLSVLLGQTALAALDWRDVLVNGDLAGTDWSEILDEALGPLP